MDHVNPGLHHGVQGELLVVGALGPLQMARVDWMQGVGTVWALHGAAAIGSAATVRRITTGRGVGVVEVAAIQRLAGKEIRSFDALVLEPRVGEPAPYGRTDDVHSRGAQEKEEDEVSNRDSGQTHFAALILSLPCVRITGWVFIYLLLHWEGKVTGIKQSGQGHGWKSR